MNRGQSVPHHFHSIVLPMQSEDERMDFFQLDVALATGAAQEQQIKRNLAHTRKFLSKDLCM